MGRVVCILQMRKLEPGEVRTLRQLHLEHRAARVRMWVF